ncbi:hypothetical protein HORIV_07300 [Vreelandella olivaria]|uniref:Ribonuclease n=1 Tax=Vreelandella olivaria TaxID=390919 RepID=A0ABN5WMU3_9GAMM|nr:hypothetical protein HORIV_07300 [Halomonas olivaria]
MAIEHWLIEHKDFPTLEIAYRGERLAGVDEVGRGPLIGSVVAAAVILDPAQPIDGLTDSKKLTARKREALDSQIRERALAFAVAEASAAEVDALNIYHATHLAMRRAIDALEPAAEYLLVDGNKLPGHLLPGQAVVRAIHATVPLPQRRFWPRSLAMRRWSPWMSAILSMVLRAIKATRPKST